MTEIRPADVLNRDPETLTLSDYQRLARLTDRSTADRRHDLAFPSLGLFGEVGGLLSEVKKKQRDADSYMGYEASVLEELGDALWYLSNLAERAGINLAKLAGVEPAPARTVASAITFISLQPELQARGPKPPQAFEGRLLKLAGLVGETVASARNPSPDFELQLKAVFQTLTAVADDAGVRLADAAHTNLGKIFDRWPLEKIFPPLFDDGDLPEECLPRRIEMEIFERQVSGKTYVVQRCNGINIGDRLTDNRLEHDDYRFHDVFHLAYAAVLGWSPVIRALFRVKRKSKPAIDEAQDGARAILIEEGIAIWIFNHGRALNFFEKLDAVDYGLLKAVRRLVDGYEVDRCPLWLWEQAILQGFEIFRALKTHRRGRIIADLITRTVHFEEMVQ